MIEKLCEVIACFFIRQIPSLEEKREVGLGLRTKYLFTIPFRFQSGLFGLSYPHIVLQAEVQIHIRASLASMGGNPAPEDLIRAAEIIREGALLVQELEAMNLSYTETF